MPFASFQRHFSSLHDKRQSAKITYPALLSLLDLRGTLVTIDAVACQTQIASAIVDQGTNYLLAVKNNRSKLAKAIRNAFAEQRLAMIDKEKFKPERGHGHVESRQCHVLSAEVLDGDFSRWKDLTSLVRVENLRLVKGKELILEYRYYISAKALSAEQAANAVREHRGIESMHWVLDVSMNEDACQIYKNNGAENLSCLRHIGLNMLRKEPTKLSIVGKRKRCLMNTAHLEAVLRAGLTDEDKK